MTRLINGFLALAVAATFFGAVPAMAQVPYPVYPNPAYVDREHVRMWGTVQALDMDNRLITVASQNGTFTMKLDRDVTYRDLRHIHVGDRVRISGHIRHDGDMVADDVMRAEHAHY